MKRIGMKPIATKPIDIKGIVILKNRYIKYIAILIYSVGMTLYWVRLGQEHTWWISVYRWRCTGGGGYINWDRIKLGAYMVDIHVQVEMYEG